MRLRGRLLATVGLLLTVAELPPGLQATGAATFDVTNANDAGPGSLRQAMLDASASGGDDTVVVAPGLGTIVITSGELAHSPGDGAGLTVEGNGVTIDAGGASRVLSHTSTGALVLVGLTITGGNATGLPGSGGGVVSSGPVTLVDATVTRNVAVADGGGIFAPRLTAERSTFRDNHAQRNGGGFFTSGASTLVDSTVAANVADSLGGGAVGEAGLTLTNSTVTANTASSLSGGGGLFSFLDVSLVYATVVENSSPAGANVDLDRTLTSFGSVVALPGGGGVNCAVGGSTSSNGFNFSDDDSCALAADGDRQSAGDPALAPLGAHGGPTATRPPLADSPLVDAIPAASCQADGAAGVAADQRGVARPQGPGCDVGAVELAAGIPPAGPATPLPRQPRFTG